MNKPLLKRIGCHDCSQLVKNQRHKSLRVKSKTRLGKMIVEILRSKDTATHYFLGTVFQGNLYKHRCSKDSVPAVPHTAVAEVSK